jgi:hypothetical protein
VPIYEIDKQAKREKDVVAISSYLHKIEALGLGRFRPTQEWRPAEEIAGDLHGVRRIWLELTGRCNLQCIHCYAAVAEGGGCSSPPDVSLLLRAVGEAAELGAEWIPLIGAMLVENDLRIGNEGAASKAMKQALAYLESTDELNRILKHYDSFLFVVSNRGRRAGLACHPARMVFNCLRLSRPARGKLPLSPAAGWSLQAVTRRLSTSVTRRSEGWRSTNGSAWHSHPRGPVRSRGRSMPR